MSPNPKRTLLVYAVTVVLLFGVIAQLLGPIQWTREAEGTSETNIFTSEEPWSMVGTLMLAGFRAIAVDLLWVRVMDAQQEGQWHEIVFLNDLIIQLQPRFEEAYIFNGWNMAYNIHHEAETREEKYGWIMAGYNLLRTGARRNPQLYQVKFWAGWVLFDKVAGDYNNASYYIERYMAENNGRHPFRDAAVWFERAYYTPGRQLWAHRMMMTTAYVRLAEYHYIRKEETRFQESLKSMYRLSQEILREDPENDVARNLLTSWGFYLRQRGMRREAAAWLQANPEKAIAELKKLLALWEKELEGNPYGIVPNAEASMAGRFLGDDELNRQKNTKAACEYYQAAYKSLKLVSQRTRNYENLDKQVKELEELLEKHDCTKLLEPEPRR